MYDYEAKLTPLKLVAVHLGAGNTKDSDIEKSKEFARKICEEIMLQQSEYLESGGLSKKHLDNLPFTPESAVIQLVQRMEDNPDLNCGLGSNLNMQGEVECDAGFMSSRTKTWCGVGAISGCKNPIALVKSIYDEQSTPRPLGLVQPNLLVGAAGAKQWMREHCPHLMVHRSKLITSKAFSQYQKFKSRYDSAVKESKDATDSKNSQSNSEMPTEHPEGKSNKGPEASSSPASLDHRTYCVPEKKSKCSYTQTDRAVEQETESYDTVGAIAVDFRGNFVTAVSSGGVLLKSKGRLGQAAVPGAGCWIQDRVAVTTTGVGESLTNSLFAKKVCEYIEKMRGPDDEELHPGIDDEVDFDEILKGSFNCLSEKAGRLAGFLAVCVLKEHENFYLSYGHTTRTMCIGYMTCDDVAGHSLMSRQDVEENMGEPLVDTIKFSIDIFKQKY